MGQAVRHWVVLSCQVLDVRGEFRYEDQVADQSSNVLAMTKVNATGAPGQGWARIVAPAMASLVAAKASDIAVVQKRTCLAGLPLWAL